MSRIKTSIWSPRKTWLCAWWRRTCWQHSGKTLFVVGHQVWLWPIPLYRNSKSKVFLHVWLKESTIDIWCCSFLCNRTYKHTWYPPFPKPQSGCSLFLVFKHGPASVTMAVCTIFAYLNLIVQTEFGQLAVLGSLVWSFKRHTGNQLTENGKNEKYIQYYFV